MKPKNIKEAKALIKRYRSITLDEIKEQMNGCTVLHSRHKTNLTGFGNYPGCTLCRAIEVDGSLLIRCRNCIYGFGSPLDNGCFFKGNKKTYEAIQDAKTPIKLLNAYRKRANHIEALLKTF